MSRIPHVLLASGVAMLLAGCAAVTPTTAPSETDVPVVVPSGTVTAAEEATPSPQPSAMDVESIPGCDDIFAVDRVRELLDDARVEAFGQVDHQTVLPGPLARRMYAAATATLACLWGIPESDGLVHVNVALVSRTERDALVDALTDSTEYVHERHGETPTFSKEITEGNGTSLSYAFAGNIWVIVEGTMVSPATGRAMAAEAAQSVGTATR